MPRMTATEVARNFSEVLNRVAAGEDVEVTRNGAPVALVTPPRARFVSAEHLRELIASLPAPDDAFADDLREIRASVEPPRDPWRS